MVIHLYKDTTGGGDGGDGSSFPHIEEYVEDDGSTFESGAAFIQALRLTTSNLPAGDYHISWYYEVKNSTHNGITRSRVQLNDSAVETDLSFTDTVIAGNVTIEQALSGFKRVTLDAGVHNIDIDMYPLTGATGQVLRKRIMIRQVA